MKIMKYIILILVVVQAGSLSAQVLYPDVDLKTKSFSTDGSYANYTVGLDPSSAYGATPIGTIMKVRIKTTNKNPILNEVRLYSDNTGTTLVSSSTTSGRVSRGSEVYEWILDKPFDVTSGTQMLASHCQSSSYVDVRNGYKLKYGSDSNHPTSSSSDRFFSLQYVYPAPPHRRIIIIE